MKWGMKKSSSSPSPTQIITHVLPVSWFSKFKQKGGSPETVPAKKQQQRRKRDFPSSGRRVARFYDDSDDAYLTLSFRKETKTEESSPGGGANPIWYDSDEEFKLPVSSFKSFGLREIEAPTGEVRKQFKKGDNGPVEAGKIDQSRGQRKTEQNRGKACSVKKESRIKVLEDKKKARTKIKKRGKKEVVEDRRTVFDSCAVVKCSSDPQQDFRDSMVEMIIEKRIKRPAELEELLASYLMLNSDVYQKLIIKVFQQVWLELNKDDLA